MMELPAPPLAVSIERAALASIEGLAGRPAVEGRAAPRVRLGIDLCSIERVAESLACFGSHYLERIYTPAEAAYAMAAPVLAPERLAARFAAKEAAMKAFGLGERGVGWTEIEVVRAGDGACTLALHGRAAAVAGLAPDAEVAVSLTHDDDHAAAVVLALG